MARIEDLIDEIPDPDLRDQIAREVKELKSTKRFGLVYEDHVPETVSLFGLPVRPGSIVQKRTEPDDLGWYEVRAVGGDTASIVPVGAEEPIEEIAIGDLLTVKRFEEPIYPGLTPVGGVRRGPEDKPAHTVISGENYHALQLLAYTHAGKVDVIYIDPPYNTGDKSWKYNNRFVDSNDSYRHSRWLAMMEKRLRLAEKLLKPDGVLIVTIDEHEVSRLSLMMEDALPGRVTQMITIVHNPKGTYKRDLSRVEEYALVSVPSDRETIVSLPAELFAQAETPESMAALREKLGDAEDLYLRRRGQHSGYRHQRPNQFFALLVDVEAETVVGLGPNLGSDEPWESKTEDGIEWVYPIDTRGDERVWRYSRDTMQEYIDRGEIVVTGRSSRSGQGWVLNHRVQRSEQVRRVKTVWWERRHDAGAHGSDLVTSLLGGAGGFPYPKSLYAVRDSLAMVVADRPKAVVLDFFAGSATTLHATLLLNDADEGRRSCVVVTNNEVSDDIARSLAARGVFQGDEEYEDNGIFEAVAKPRVQAAITGLRADGSPVEGEYTWHGRKAMADGFDENVAFFRMDYLEPDLVELNRQYEAIVPLLWMTAGSVGHWEPWDGSSAWSAPTDSTYAVLFDESEAAAFGAYVESRSDQITHAWIVTDSHSAYLDLQAQLPSGIEVGQLYRDYLRNFVVNAPGAVR